MAHLPSRFEVHVNGEPRSVEAGTTVADLLAELELSGRVAVERNREVVPRDRHDRVELGPGDRLEVVTFVGGG